MSHKRRRTDDEEEESSHSSSNDNETWHVIVYVDVSPFKLPFPIRFYYRFTEKCWNAVEEMLLKGVKDGQVCLSDRDDCNIPLERDDFKLVLKERVNPSYYASMERLVKRKLHQDLEDTSYEFIIKV